MPKLNYKATVRISCLLIAVQLFSCNPASDKKATGEKVNAYNNIAMDGFDVVAYFKQSKPVKGDDQFVVEHKGKHWLFGSAENAEAFTQNPSAYEPQFNGWCAYAISEGYAAEVDFVNGWAMLDGKLYLNWDAEIRDVFIDEQKKRKARANENWDAVHSGIQDGSVELYTHSQEGLDIVHPQEP